jgi:type IV secretory pathway VirB2 component (pilin)
VSVAEIFLGVIAVATLAMAIGLVGAVVAAARLARQVGRILDQLEVDLRPLFDHLNAIGRDASRAAALASAQVERVDRVLNDLALRVDQALRSVQAILNGPVREGQAVVTALAAALRAMRGGARSRHARGDDEDALFI